MGVSGAAVRAVTGPWTAVSANTLGVGKWLEGSGVWAEALGPAQAPPSGCGVWGVDNLFRRRLLPQRARTMRPFP